MHPINWLIVVGWIGYILVDGVRRAKGTREIEGYFLANRSLPRWAVGLSVMATQLSAITLIGTTGQGATDGLRFVRSEEHTSELQSHSDLVCRLLLQKKK